jgi:hypothetical protein
VAMTMSPIVCRSYDGGRPHSRGRDQVQRFYMARYRWLAEIARKCPLAPST